MNDLENLDELFSSEMNFLLHNENYNIPNSDICIGVSGGSDSIALLYLCYKWSFYNTDRKIICVTVDHNLREDSYNEAMMVSEICSAFSIEHVILKWNRSFDVSIGKLENQAREARYRLLVEFCKNRKISLIMTGHNRNDQLETFELRKKFKSSSRGLSGMSRLRSLDENIYLLRPLLRIYNQNLKNMLMKNGIQWKEDPMNYMDDFLRVKIRKKLKQKDAKQISIIGNAIDSFGYKRNNIEKKAVAFLKSDFCNFSSNGYIKLSLDILKANDIDVIKEILSRCLWNVGGKKYAPYIDEKMALNILNKKINSIGRCIIKINKNNMFIYRENRDIFEKSIENEIIFDNRFLMNIEKNKNAEIFVTSAYKKIDFLENTSAFRNIPIDATFGLPCVFKNNKILMVHGMYTDFSYGKIKSVFMHKVGLFDVFVC